MNRMLEGRAIAITGAGAGLGRAYARACARAGARLVVNDVDAGALGTLVDELAGDGTEVTGMAGSIASWDTARDLVATAESAYGRLDGFVANAGIKHENLPWEEQAEPLREIVAVNVLGVQFCARHAMAAMARTGGGSIVTVVSGARFGIRQQSAYGATKGAVAAMTAGWALDAAAIGVRVNAISPLAETPMAQHDLRADRPFLADPDHVAPLVVALLSDATRAVSGRIFRFDGQLLSEYRPSAPTTLAEGLGPGSLADAHRLTELLR